MAGRVGGDDRVGKEDLAFPAAGLAVGEHLDREPRAWRAPNMPLHDDLAAAPLHAVDRRRCDAPIRQRLAVGRAVRAYPREALGPDHDADAARADIAGVFGAGGAEHDAAASQIGVAAAAGKAA